MSTHCEHKEMFLLLDKRKPIVVYEPPEVVYKDNTTDNILPSKIVSYISFLVPVKTRIDLNTVYKKMIFWNDGRKQTLPEWSHITDVIIRPLTTLNPYFLVKELHIR